MGLQSHNTATLFDANYTPILNEATDVHHSVAICNLMQCNQWLLCSLHLMQLCANRFSFYFGGDHQCVASEFQISKRVNHFVTTKASNQLSLTCQHCHIIGPLLAHAEPETSMRSARSIKLISRSCSYWPGCQDHLYNGPQWWGHHAIKEPKHT